MSLENLYSRLAAGTAKYRPGPSERLDVALLTEWTTTQAIEEMIGSRNDVTLKLLNRLRTEGILERRRRKAHMKNGNVPFEWRLKPKEKIWLK